MKKGDKLREIGYFLEIKDVRHSQWVYPISCRSLREAVEESANYVQDMDNYLKVYRHCNAAGGVYISTFLSIPTETNPARTLIVQITAYELLTPEELKAAMEYMDRVGERLDTQAGKRGKRAKSRSAS